MKEIKIQNEVEADDQKLAWGAKGLLCLIINVWEKKRIIFINAKVSTLKRQ